MWRVCDVEAWLDEPAELVVLDNLGREVVWMQSIGHIASGDEGRVIDAFYVAVVGEVARVETVRPQLVVV